MRSEQVQTHLRCNQNCTYCNARRTTDDPAFVRASAVIARVDAVRAAGAREVVLSGGEPALRRDLASLITAARHAGAERVALETNATVIDATRASELREAGLERALVNLAGDGPWLDAVTRDPGGFEATVRGIDALLAAGVRVDVQAAVIRSTAARLPELPAFVRERFGERVRTLLLTVPTSAPDASELLDYDTAGRVVRAVEMRARQAGVALKLAPGSGPPPCVHGRDPRVAHLYSLTPGASVRRDHVHLAACETCVVRDRCAGIPREVLDRTGAPSMTPVTTDRARRRLSLISTVEEQVARELVTPNRYLDPVHGDVDEALVRVVFQCNQACRFCFVSTHLPAAESDAIERAIRDAATSGKKVTLSGGEPTLHPELVRYVRLAKSLSKLPVLLQTNAIRLADPALARALVDAGIDEAFVSLHGATAAVSDLVTQAPGTFEKTVRGVDQLVALGTNVTLNFVICQANLHELPAWVALIADRWPRVFANVSFVAPSTDVVPREHALVPRYADVLPVLADAVALAESRGVEIGGFESMCGVPLCLVPRSLDRYFELSEVPPGFDAGEFVKTDTCARCSLASRCYGIRRGYVELHGASELRPVG
ncbi:radical SAM protein [Sandaracinus amylolyticus]|uniref:Molybdopterin-based tungsten cofactor biosynthesis protein 1 n=1 Tax=Sandaracinus amylolyticus TaxID=927083 RepID=A0A0F6VZ05_9BACT|nr:radical SAM protein [Sandaracinus amylolyticus]AKF03230.1 Molybdopterin-based tungsten cofactor biosynthesis protein 1 [Sandaracinus amylolyticus]